MQTLEEWLRDRVPTFQPIPWCNAAGKLIEWHWKNEAEYAESIMWEGRWIGSVYKSQETGEVTGVEIHLEAIRGAGINVSPDEGS